MLFLSEYLLSQQAFKRGPLFYYSKTDRHSRQQESKFEEIEEVNLLPFGVSGFGYVGNTQYYNICNINDYVDVILNTAKMPVWMGTTLSREERRRRTVMFDLKSKGVNRQLYKARFEIDPLKAFPEEIRFLLDNGLVDISEKQISLSEWGVLFADEIAGRFASKGVQDRVRNTNSQIKDPRKDPLEVYDFSPLGRMADITRAISPSFTLSNGCRE